MNKFALNRRSMIQGLGVGLAVNSVLPGAATEPPVGLANDFFPASGPQQFSLVFRLAAGDAGEIRADNLAFRLRFSADRVELQGKSCRQSSKPVSGALPEPGPRLCALVWRSAGREACLQIHVNGKLLAKLDFSSPANHASPLLRSFDRVVWDKLEPGDLRGLPFALDEKEILELGQALPSRQVDTHLGPYIGQIKPDGACLWLRAGQPGPFLARLIDTAGRIVAEQTLQALCEHDLTLTWRFEGLQAASLYRYEVQGPGLPRQSGDLKTPAADNSGKLRIVLGSCAPSLDHEVLHSFVGLKPDVAFLMGDTPYIDHAELAVMRHSHRQFLALDPFRLAFGAIPFAGTWDDHDFGFNDSDGRFSSRLSSRQVFAEYRPQFSYGDGKEGIYSSLRLGPLEIFLLDCRFFSSTAPSPVDPKQKTLLGAAQWEWLKKGLKSSSASFKILACGMIWDDKKGSEKDHWESYPAERRELLAFIRRERIGGVSLFGGDIHVSRLLGYGREEIGYPLYQFISSPMHDSVIPALNVSHPALLWSAVHKHSFLLIDIDHSRADPTLHASFLDQKGQPLHEITLKLSELQPG
ncbi:MAG: Alkaline phosphatase precursor [Verrucomicrobiota bacterium]|jgi:alkaline phosphatase D